MKARKATPLARIQLVILDVDGVLTDGRLYFSAHGEALKVFHVRDGHGIKLLLAAGVAVAAFSGRRSAAAAARMRELGVPHVVQACSDKVAALGRLTEHVWPGNIRELRNVIRSAFAICDHKVIRLCDLPAQLSLEGRSHTTATVSGHITHPSDPLAHAERETLLSAIRASRGNLCHTAKQLGISRNSLYRKLKRHGIAVSRIDGLSVRGGTDH